MAVSAMPSAPAGDDFARPSMTSAVTVIVPFRNQGDLLMQAARSLQAQRFGQWLALLINDGSGSEAIAKAQALCNRDPRFRLLHAPGAKPAPGPWLARNVGLDASTTRLVAFLDADDLWHPDKLSRQLPLHDRFPNMLTVCGYHRFDATSLQLMETRVPPVGLDFACLLLGNSIPLSTVIVDRDVLIAAGGFYPEHHEDYGLWLRLFAQKSPPNYCCLPSLLMAYRLHAKSVSAARHRSLFAVDGLFRQHLPRRRERWPKLANWVLEQIRSHAGVVRERNWRPQALPEPFHSLLTI